MCDMMLAVPMIGRQQVVKRHWPVLRVDESSRIVVRRDRVKQSDPTIVKHLEHRERRLDRRRAAVLELGPCLLVVRLDRRPVLRQRPLEPDVRIHMTVGHVVHKLPNSPSLGAIRCIELRVVEATNGGAQIRRRCGDGVDGGSAFRLGERRRPL